MNAEPRRRLSVARSQRDPTPEEVRAFETRMVRWLVTVALKARPPLAEGPDTGQPAPPTSPTTS